MPDKGSDGHLPEPSLTKRASSAFFFSPVLARAGEKKNVVQTELL